MPVGTAVGATLALLGDGVTGTVGVGSAEGGMVTTKIVVGFGEGASDGALVLRLRGCSSVGNGVTGVVGVGPAEGGTVSAKIVVGFGEGASDGALVLRLCGCSSVGD
jgi:hypothetical protein